MGYMLCGGFLMFLGVMLGAAIAGAARKSVETS